MTKQLTEQQQTFLDALFGEAKGNPVLAKKIAGYSDNKATSVIMNSLKDEILERTKLYLATHAPKAAMSVVDGMNDPTELGFKEKLSAAKDLLDRVGIIKTEKVMVEAAPGIVVLPPKNDS
jgi:hypothetical protein